MWILFDLDFSSLFRFSSVSSLLLSESGLRGKVSVLYVADKLIFVIIQIFRMSFDDELDRPTLKRDCPSASARVLAPWVTIYVTFSVQRETFPPSIVYVPKARAPRVVKTNKPNGDKNHLDWG